MKPFCQAAWTTMLYGGAYSGGGVSPCCEWKGDIFDGPIGEYERSDFLENIKARMISHDMEFINDNCRECIEVENLGDISARQHIQKRVDSDNKYNKYNIGKFNKIDYRPDNLCNLKCRMCSPGSSSLIEEEQVKLKYIEPIVQRDTADILTFDLSDTKSLAILGGEPTVNPKVFPLLDKLIDEKLNETIQLQYTTNCTSVNEPWMKRIRQFPMVHINLSIDAAGKAYEYIRTGAQWDKVKNNIPKIIKLSEEETDYDIQMVVQTHSFAIIEDWFEYFLQFPTENINMTPLQGYAGKLNCMPDHIKKQKIRYLESFNHPTARMAIKHFEIDQYNPVEADRYSRQTSWLDHVRGTSIYDLDPIFEDILTTTEFPLAFQHLSLPDE